MDIHLTFANGLMSGDGRDDVGTFLIKGRYDSASAECHWTKSYLGAHDVYYRGFREGKGIWGTWEISIRDHGGFHIWPRSAGSLAASSSASEQREPVDAIGTETANPKQEPIEIQARNVNELTSAAGSTSRISH